MARFRDLSIRRKLQRASIIVALAALASAAAAFVVYDVYTFRGMMKTRIATEARILAFNSVSPLLFNDADTAATTLAGLQAEAHLEAAGVYGRSGKLFASYVRAASDAPPTTVSEEAATSRFVGRTLVVTEPVIFEGARIGTVLIRAETGEIRDRIVQYAGIVAIVLLGSLGAAQLISHRLHGAIAGPILHLAHTASIVSTQQDYSVRATVVGGDEIGKLVVTFNEMLAQIQAQDAELRESQSSLERRVEERTQELETRSAELAAANKELEAFCYSVSHDLRAPLRGIDGFSRTLLDDYAGKTLDEQGSHYLRRVRANTQRMGELIDDLLHLSRLTRADLVRTRVDMTAVAKRVGAELASRDPGRQVDFVVEEGLVADADAHLVPVVFENLLGNAWKFSGKRADARVEVGRRPNGGEDVFFVRDNGAGFDMQYADKLFGVFQRLHGAAEFEGTGIGLATVQRVVLRHGGRIWAESAPGRGASFYFTLGGRA
jgi:signal transduction histidine kinase